MAKVRNVLHVLRSVEGGVPVVVDQIVNGLDRKRYEPIVLFDTHAQSEIRNKLLLSEIKTIDLKKCADNRPNSTAKPGKNLDITRRLEASFNKEAGKIYLSIKAFATFLKNQAPNIRSFIRAFKDNRVHLVHTHSDLHWGKPEIIAARLCGIPCISHNHGYSNFNYFDKIFAYIVDAFVNISKDVAEHHAAQGGSRYKGPVIHNGICINKFTRQYDTNSVREEFDFKPDQILVGIIGRIDWWKGHEFFIKAIAEATKQISGLRALIIGSIVKNEIAFRRNQRYFQKLKKLINSLDLSDKIIFTGSRNDVPRLIAALDVVVHASSNPEPFGLVVIEGMAAGKPVVATAAGGVLDIIEDGVNGLTVPCKDSGAMARAILKIISNPDKAKQMGIAARRRVAEKFTVEHQVKAVEKLYDKILRDPKRLKRFRR